jgi:hypothetical protein
LRRIVLLASILAGTAHGLSAQQPTTWWPDPTTGIMWTGNLVGPVKSIDYQQAQARCASVTIGSYTGWRLPTVDEINAATIGYTAYYTVHQGPHGVLDHEDSAPVSELKFNNFSAWPLWTSSPADQDKIYVINFSRPGKKFPVKPTATGGYAQAFCVRTMEPDLLQLAKDAHPPSPVTGLSQLQSIALLVKAEDALDSDQFDAAVSDAQQALVLDTKSIRALHDMGIADAYAGRWTEALATLDTAHTLDKNLTETYDDIKWVQGFQKEAATDPNAIHAWVWVHDADVAQSDKRYEDAIAAANRVIAVEPTWPEGYDRLGLALGGVDRWPDAVTALSKAVSLDKHKETNARQDLKNAKKIHKEAD